MAKLNLVVGSMLGAAEYVADHVANLLELAGHQAEIHKHQPCRGVAERTPLRWWYLPHGP